MNRYFDEMVLCASPVELVRLLYQKAIASAQAAREHLNAGRIAERAQSINNAYLVLAELTASLQSEAAPELTARLSALYAYMQNRLLEANLRQEDAPLAEVLGLLATLSESWGAVPELIEASPDCGQTAASQARIAVTA
jgi:flagellar protein FliS